MLTTRFASKQGSTFKKALQTLKPGDSIEVSDLDGDFIVSDWKKHYVFIAGGIVDAKLVRDNGQWKIAHISNTVVWRAGGFKDMAQTGKAPLDLRGAT